MANCIRKDYISRTLIIITEKYNLNGDPKIIDYETFNKEIKNTISIMTGNINLKVVEEIIKSLEELENQNEKEVKKPDENYCDCKSDEEEIEEIENEGYSKIDKLSKFIDKVKFIENADISFSFYSDKNLNNNDSENFNNDIMNDSMGMDSHDISNDSIGDVSNDTEINVINLKKIKKGRGTLNVFTLDNFKKKKKLDNF